MEKFADKIEDLLQEKLTCYKQLTDILEKERGVILAMDVGLLWQLSAKKNEIAKTIESIRNSILRLFDQQGIDHSMDAASFSLVKLISLFSVSNRKKADFLAVKFAINSEKAEVARLAFGNQKYVRDRLQIIEDLVATIIPMPKSDRYGGRGAIMLSDKANCFINKEV